MKTPKRILDAACSLVKQARQEHRDMLKARRERNINADSWHHGRRCGLLHAAGLILHPEGFGWRMRCINNGGVAPDEFEQRLQWAREAASRRLARRLGK